MYLILETANTHGGSLDYLFSLIDEFKKINYKNLGMKFQVFKYDQIACKDYEWYSVYKKLYFTSKKWTDIINKANESFDVWLDIFDTYGAQILRRNYKNIYGIKLQSSVLKNEKIITELEDLKMEDKFIIINIAGYGIKQVKDLIINYEKRLNPKELLIEIGFQSYPTKSNDSGLSKIKVIRNFCDNRIVFADHSDPLSKSAIELPFMASVKGVEVIEKHIMHSNLNTKYDFHSSLKINQIKLLIEKINFHKKLIDQNFMNKREKDYLNKTIQLPVISKTKLSGEFINTNDFNFKRTNQKGLNFDNLNKKIISGFIKLKNKKNKDEVLKINDLDQVKIGCIVAVRLKSSRLKNKALLKIGNLSSIELCLKNCLSLNRINNVVMATSNLKEDKILSNYTYDKRVVFYEGDPNNVINRYLSIINKLDIDIFLRVTGDMPYISNDIFSYLLESHFRAGADYTSANKAAIGTNLEIINSNALKKIKKFFPNGEYSEYMTWYFQNNPKYFKINLIDLPKKWIRDYRLTLDYDEDLKMLNKIQNHFEKNNLNFSIENLFEFLDSNPEIPMINSKMKLTYRTDQKLIKTLNQKTKILNYET